MNARHNDSVGRLRVPLGQQKASQETGGLSLAKKHENLGIYLTAPVLADDPQVFVLLVKSARQIVGPVLARGLDVCNFGK